MGLGKFIGIAKSPLGVPGAILGEAMEGGGGDYSEDPYEKRRREDLQKVKDYTKQLGNEATDFRSNLPGYQEKSLGVQQDSLRRDLAKNLAGVDRSSNRRGLLYSGLREGGRAQAIGGYGSALAQRRAGINDASEQMASGMEDRAIQADIQRVGLENQGNQSAYQAALARREGNNAGMAGLMGGIGSFMGSAAGKK